MRSLPPTGQRMAGPPSPSVWLQHLLRTRNADAPWMDPRYRLHFSGPYVAGRGVLGAVMAFDQKAACLFAVIEDD